MRLHKEHVMESPAFPPESERAMIEHMNEWYADANLRYARVYGNLWSATAACLVALDRQGMELDVTTPEGARRIRIPFDHHLQDEGDAQQTLVEMSFKAREMLAQQASKNA
jgi:putative heme iron utilization protein